MITSLMRWFSGSAECAAPDERPHVVARALPAPRVPLGGRAFGPSGGQPHVRRRGHPRHGRSNSRVCRCASGRPAGRRRASPAGRNPGPERAAFHRQPGHGCPGGPPPRPRPGRRRVRLAKELQPAVREALAWAELLDLFETTTDADLAQYPAGPTCGYSSQLVAV
jgi:hypothetical protein